MEQSQPFYPLRKTKQQEGTLNFFSECSALENLFVTFQVGQASFYKDSQARMSLNNGPIPGARISFQYMDCLHQYFRSYIHA